MFLSPNLVYLEMPKTASTYTRHLIARYEPGELRPKHQPLVSEPGGRLVATSVRDPWDWYVSMWAFGCRGRGLLYRQMTGRQHAKAAAKALRERRLDMVGVTAAAALRSVLISQRQSVWRRVYSDPYDPALFREWLVMLLDERTRRILPWGYGQSDTRHCAGLMTYLFLSLATEQSAWRSVGRSIGEAAALGSFTDRHFLLDRAIRLERLEDDLAALLGEVGHAVTPAALRGTEKANVSARRSVREYYDPETADLVAREERLLIERFGYQSPDLGPSVRTVA